MLQRLQARKLKHDDEGSDLAYHKGILSGYEVLS